MGFRVRAEDAFVESRCQTTHLLHTVSVCGGRNNARWCPEICYTAVRFLRSDFNYDRRFVSTICMSAVRPQNSRSHNYVYASNTPKLDHECVTPLWPGLQRLAEQHCRGCTTVATTPHSTLATQALIWITCGK